MHWLRQEGFPVGDRYAGVSGEHCDAPVADDIEAGAMVMPGARGLVAMGALVRDIRHWRGSGPVASIGMVGMDGAVFTMRRGVPVGTDHRCQQKGKGARCGYASC